MLKNNKGITLISLSITIIVLLILLSVTFEYTLGENSILDSSTEYKNSAEKSIVKDEIENILLKYKMANMDTGISIIDYFTNLSDITSITDNGNNTYTVVKDGVSVIVRDFKIIDVK